MNLFLILFIFIAIMLLGTPIGFAIGSLTCTVFVILGGDLSIIPQKLFAGIDSYSYVCILLYILATDIMSEGGITEAIVDFCNSIIGHVKGGLAHVNVLASMFFAGLSGSAIADASGLGPLEIKMMEDAGYDRDFSASVTAASAIIGPIIPPSNIMIVFAGCVGTISVGKLFLAGVFPGILLGLGYMILCYFMAIKRNMPCRKEKANLKEILESLRKTYPALLLPVIIIGSIIGGVCTATETGALAVLYAVIVALLQKKLTFKTFVDCCVRSAKSASNVLFIIAVSTAMGWAITTLQIAQKLTVFCVQFISSKYIFLLFLNVLLLIVGTVLDATPAMLLLVPILIPVSRAFGVSDISFGIIVCLNLMIGNITPPVGMMLFVVSNVGDVKLSSLYKEIIPFCIIAIICLFLITYFPWFTTFLPSLLK